jgi:hypothetical protein
MMINLHACVDRLLNILVPWIKKMHHKLSPVRTTTNIQYQLSYILTAT